MNHTARRPAIHTRPWALWFALLVAWASALVPTVSHALAWRQGGAPNYLTICTTAGSVVIDTASPNSGEPSPGGQGTSSAMLHCPFCLHANDRSAPPPEPVAYSLPINSAPRDATLLRAQARPATLYAHAAPRGPPAFS